MPWKQSRHLRLQSYFNYACVAPKRWKHNVSTRGVARGGFVFFSFETINPLIGRQRTLFFLGHHILSDWKPTRFAENTFFFLVFSYILADKGWHHEIPPRVPPFLATPQVSTYIKPELRPTFCQSQFRTQPDLQLGTDVAIWKACGRVRARISASTANNVEVVLRSEVCKLLSIAIKVQSILLRKIFNDLTRHNN